jgi:hypothetical protein
MRIRDTLSLEEIWLSANLLEEVRTSAAFVSAEPAQPLAFKAGHLF